MFLFLLSPRIGGSTADSSQDTLHLAIPLWTGRCTLSSSCWLALASPCMYSFIIEDDHGQFCANFWLGWVCCWHDDACTANVPSIRFEDRIRLWTVLALTLSLLAGDDVLCRCVHGRLARFPSAMPVRDIVGQWETRAAVNESPTSSSSPRPAPRRLSLPPPSLSPTPSLNASIRTSSGTFVPLSRPARFVRHPLLVQSSPSLPLVTPPRTSRHDLTTPSPITSSSRRQSLDSRRLSFAAAQREAASASPPSRGAAAQDQQPSRATVSTARRISLRPSITSHTSDTQSVTVAASIKSTSQPRVSADALSPAPSSQDTLRNPFQDPVQDTGSSTAEFLPLKPVLKEVVEEDPPSPTSTLIQLSVDKRGRRRHEPIPAKTVFAKTAPPLHLPHLNEYLAALDAPVFGQFPSDEPADDKRRGRRWGKGKAKDSGEPPMFPPMAVMEATGLSLDDLEHNAAKLRPWQDRNSIFSSLSNWVLGATVSRSLKRRMRVLIQSPGFQRCCQALQFARDL